MNLTEIEPRKRGICIDFTLIPLYSKFLCYLCQNLCPFWDLLKGIKHSTSACVMQPCLPVTISVLRSLQTSFTSSLHTTVDKLILWSAITTVFFGLLDSEVFFAPKVQQFDPAITLLRSIIEILPDVFCSHSKAQTLTFFVKVSPFGLLDLAPLLALIQPCTVSFLILLLFQAHFLVALMAHSSGNRFLLVLSISYCRQQYTKMPTSLLIVSV